MQLFPKFEDFDQVKNGHVSKSQFRRVLTELRLDTLMNTTELESLMKKYNSRIGTRDDINYVEFCDQVYEAAEFEYRKP